jgi:hypothetical protein
MQLKYDTLNDNTIMTMASDNIDALAILDKEAAIKELGNEGLFDMMLEGFEDMTMRKNLTQIMIAMDDLNFGAVARQANSLKGAVSYLHAERIQVLSDKLISDVEARNPEAIFQDYSQLIVQCITLKRKIRYEESKKKGTSASTL